MSGRSNNPHGAYHGPFPEAVIGLIGAADAGLLREKQMGLGRGVAMSMVRLTKKGLKALKADGLQGTKLLVMEVAKRAPNITPRHLAELCAELHDIYRTPENAVEALRAGAVVLDRLQS